MLRNEQREHTAGDVLTQVWTNPILVKRIMEYLPLCRLLKVRLLNQTILKIADQLFLEGCSALFPIFKIRNQKSEIQTDADLKDFGNHPMDNKKRFLHVTSRTLRTSPFVFLCRSDLHDLSLKTSHLSLIRFRFRQMWTLPNPSLSELVRRPDKTLSLHWRVVKILFHVLRCIVWSEFKRHDIIDAFSRRCRDNKLWETLASYSGYVLVGTGCSSVLVETPQRYLNSTYRTGALRVLDTLPYASYLKIFTSCVSQYPIESILKAIFLWCRTLLYGGTFFNEDPYDL